MRLGAVGQVTWRFGLNLVLPRALAMWEDALSFPPYQQLVLTTPVTRPSPPMSLAIKPRICLVSDRSLTAWVLWAKSYRALQRLVWSLWAPVRMLGPGARRMGGPYVVPVFIAGCQARATNQHLSWAAAFPEV